MGGWYRRGYYGQKYTVQIPVSAQNKKHKISKHSKKKTEAGSNLNNNTIIIISRNYF
jgi:hypothetical protein